MKKESVYLDTSVVSAYYDERAQERREATIRFWKKSCLGMRYVYPRRRSRR